METSSIISIIVGLGLAFIPAAIAGKKGYNKVGFYFYGLFALIPSIIHAAIVPDKADTTRRGYKGNALKYSAIAVIALNLYFLMALVSAFISYMNYRITPPFTQLIVFFLMASIILGRKYKYSIGVYAAYIVLNVIDIFRGAIDVVKYIDDPYTYDYTVPVLISHFIAVIAFAVLIYIAYRYGLKGEKLLPSKFKPVFILPAILNLCGYAISLYGYHNELMYYWMNFIPAAISYVFGTCLYLFIGLFYLEDCKYSDNADIQNVA